MRIPQPWLLFVAMFASASCAGAPDKFAVHCSDGTTLTVAYSADRSSMTVADQAITRDLAQARSASGARYVGMGAEYWEKGGQVRWTPKGGATKTCFVGETGPSGPKTQLANPASVHCAEVGGRPVTERRPDGSEFGVCLFADNRSCGQWALFRGACPVGGVRVIGYATAEGRHCAITGALWASPKARGHAPRRGE